MDILSKITNLTNKIESISESITKREAKAILPKEKFSDNSIEGKLKSTGNNKLDKEENLKNAIVKMIDGEADIDDVIKQLQAKVV